MSKPRVLWPGCPIDWCSRAPRSGRTAHRVASRPPGRPLRWSVSSPSPKRAPRRRTLGQLRPASCRGWASRARLAGSAPANSSARCGAREFMPNDEPVARDRRAPAACIDLQVHARVVVAVPLCCQQAAAARRAPMARSDRTVAMRTRAHAHAPPDRRCASKAGAPPEPQPALVHCRPHPRGSRATTRAIGAGAAALALALARTLARCARRGCRLIPRKAPVARGAAGARAACIGTRSPRIRSRSRSRNRSALCMLNLTDET